MLFNILFSKNYWKLGKVNARFWKNIENIGKVTWDSFSNFAYVSSYLHLKSFPWKQDIFKTTNVTKLTKPILESCYRVLQVTSKVTTLKQTVYFQGYLNYGLHLTFKLTELSLYFGISCKTTLLGNARKVIGRYLQTQQHLYFTSIGPPIKK